MRLRVEAVPITGQAWIDTLDYHVRAAVEAVGLRLEGFTQGEGWLQSPELPEPVGARLLERLREVPLVRSFRIGADGP